MGRVAQQSGRQGGNLHMEARSSGLLDQGGPGATGGGALCLGAAS